MTREFNPLKIIILFEKVLLTANIPDKTKVLVYDLIEIIGDKPIEEIKTKYSEYQYNEHTIPDVDIKDEIKKIIPVLMKFCDAENMMNCFINRLNNV